MQEPFTPLSSVHHAPQVQHRGECGANNIEVCILHQPRATNQLHAVDLMLMIPWQVAFHHTEKVLILKHTAADGP